LYLLSGGKVSSRTCMNMNYYFFLKGLKLLAVNSNTIHYI